MVDEVERSAAKDAPESPILTKTSNRSPIAIFVELISLMTAIGTVITAWLYNNAFSRQGIPYLRIATFGDIARDGISFIVDVLETALFFLIFLLPVIWFFMVLWRIGKRRDMQSLWYRLVCFVGLLVVVVYSATYTRLGDDSLLVTGSVPVWIYDAFYEVWRKIRWVAYNALPAYLLCIALIVEAYRHFSGRASLFRYGFISRRFIYKFRMPIALVVMAFSLYSTNYRLSFLFQNPYFRYDLDRGAAIIEPRQEFAICERSVPAFRGLTTGRVISGRVAWLGDRAMVVQCAASDEGISWDVEWQIVVMNPGPIEVSYN
jgi:hypothetical protein